MVRQKLSGEEKKYKKKLYDIEYRKKNIIRLKEQKLMYTKDNKYNKKEYGRKYRINIKNKMFEILGSKCAICGEDNRIFVTIDHKNKDGAEKQKKYGSVLSEYSNLKSQGWPIDKIISNYQVLCWNHNCAKNRGYFDKSPLELNRYSRYRQKLWREAFNFFGPCYCGESNLKFLTIDHIHNDGAERRRNGEKRAAELLSYFHKLGWPESIKETYQLLCYNHNFAKALAGR